MNAGTPTSEVEELKGKDGVTDTSVDPSLLVEMIRLLEGIPPLRRRPICDAALLFLGTPMQAMPSRFSGVAPGVAVSASASRADDGELKTFHRRTQVWLTQNSLRAEQLDSIFHQGVDGVEIIANVLPGQTVKERVAQCYLLSGIRGLLASGEPKFLDRDARALCKVLGAFDAGNHSTYVKAIANYMIGSKSGSFELTQPGLRTAAELIRKMTNANSTSQDASAL